MEGLRRGAHLEWWVAARALPGQAASGDLHLVHEQLHGALLAVVDGLGHGKEAATAAQTAIQTLRAGAREPIVSLVSRCHDELRGTRGVVMSLAAFEAEGSTLTWLGIGNVEGLVLRASPGSASAPIRLLLRGGVVGAHLPALRVAAFPVRPGDTLVFVTDGVGCNFDTDLDPQSPVQLLAEKILDQHGRSTDDALVLIARFLDGQP